MISRIGRRALRAMVSVGLLAGSGVPAHSQGGVLLQGVVDLERWSTDTLSNFLSRNNGAPAQLGRVQLWGAVEPKDGVFFFAQGFTEFGNARPFDDHRTLYELRQAGMRVARDKRFVLNVGKMVHPVGTFAPRSMSTRNPLIGAPDGYSPVYPVGAMLSGEVSRMDYRVAIVSLPLTHRDYVPTPEESPRPVLGVGVTPFTGLRIGATGTIGSYLNDFLPRADLYRASWESYHQRQIVTAVEYGIGHLDLRGEEAWADYDVPGATRVGGHTGYVEGRYTILPRLFAAVRGEDTRYPLIQPGAPWVTRAYAFRDWEAGVGVRVTESTLIKASLMGDHWSQLPKASRPGGRAFAFQLSQAFDVMDWLDSRR